MCALRRRRGIVAALTVLLSACTPVLSLAQTIIIERPPSPPDRPIPLPPTPPPAPPMPPPHRPPQQPPDRPAPPRPPRRDARLDVRNLSIDVSITDGAAVTRIDQTFHNSSDAAVEGTYIFPLDDDVAISKFTMDVNGEQIEGKLLDAREARQTYEQIVRSMRDPALLEYVGRRMIKASIFPIQPNSDVRVRLSYSQMLESRDGLARYRYPLSTAKDLPAPIGTLSFLARVESKAPIKSVFSPTHEVRVSRDSDHKVSASFEGSNQTPDADLDLFYTLSDKEFGLSVLTYRQPGEDGYFLARISPDSAVKPGEAMPKDIVFVLDTSGSMSDENKIAQARSALKFCLEHLNDHDGFNIIAFSHEPRGFAQSIMPATSENRELGAKFVAGIDAVGGTNINDALLTALRAAPPPNPSRPFYVVFLTDGQPTVGETRAPDILKHVREANTSEARIFVFGVGHDVNTQLLDLLAEQNRGTREYVEPGENLELALSSFYRTIADPVLGDLTLTLGDLKTFDVYPRKLGDLFGGMELVILGRYSGSGHKAVELTGMRRGVTERHVYEAVFPDDDREHDFLPRLWATRKVGYLLDEIRLHGDDPELKNSIVALAKKYGIVTPYTSFLVTEPQRRLAEAGQAPRRPTGTGLDPERRAALKALGYIEGEDDDAQDAADGAFMGMMAGGVEAEDEAKAPAGAPPSSAPATSGGLAPTRSAPSDKSKTSGRAAVSRSQEANDLKTRVSIAAAGKKEAEVRGKPARPGMIRAVGNRTFYKVGDSWVDSAYDKKVETRKIVAFSEEYFDLLTKHKELAKCFALGERVIVVVDGTAYETVAPDPEERDDPSGRGTETPKEGAKP